ncbi:Carbohydrate esterase 4 protein, partial [Gamsiella multidivaricata]
MYILTVLGYLLAILSTYQSPVLQAAPIPASIARQATPNTYNNTFFPYNITGPAPLSQYRPGQILERCIRPNSYAISFDDGPGQLTEELLDYLDEQKLKVTFFMNGDNWNCIYQMRRIEDAFRQILGVVPRYMRPPYGEHGRRIQRVLEDMGYLIILWDVDHLEHYSPSSDQISMTGTRVHDHHHQQGDLSSSLKWAEAVRGVPSTTLDREVMTLGGIYQEATPDWAIEHVQSLGYDIMPVGRCLGEDDPRLWYKEIGRPADAESVPLSCR